MRAQKRMQHLSWDNYRYVLAIHRCQTISGAARSLLVNETTVSRRLVQIESFLKCKLFTRRSNGMVATEAGQRLLDRVERVKGELDQAVAEIADVQGAVAGPLRIATDAMIMNHVLVPRLSHLLDQFPSLECELICLDSSDRLRDADIAIYSSSNTQNDGDVTHLGELFFGVFVAQDLLESGIDDSIPWISLMGDNLSKLESSAEAPGQQSGKAQESGRRLTVDSYETLLSCVHSGLGRCRLPMGIGLRDRQLALLGEPDQTHRRDLVQVSQPELSGTARLNACSAWVHESLMQFNQLGDAEAA